ncbi:uncharacterized protein AFUA_3G07010 [Aspergillus fumigatus Af293]|uniref:Uncharacterized protein n=2 Tax=Aspergillus fumigatus TaxID=746128 RepID=Q4WWT6_ASPFU|nr:hypothetical protein AFUA_3G07010 [Aspergillus fumigatus Af293]EAL92867.1 hypothetical protein AFUA_3G07010 [Aspergillus fumigatus Af293]EDP53034.1 hypothetical protein AFUB_042050 [Aspergillus fumigatus A1163]
MVNNKSSGEIQMGNRMIMIAAHSSRPLARAVIIKVMRRSTHPAITFGHDLRIEVEIKSIHRPIVMIANDNCRGNGAVRLALLIWSGALEPRWLRRSANAFPGCQVNACVAQTVQAVEVIKSQG